MVIEISVAIIAIAFVILVIYLIVMTKELRITFNQVNQTLTEVRKQLDEMGGQAKKVIEHTNQVSFDLKRKMESLDSVFGAISNVGEILEDQTSALKKECAVSFHNKNKHAKWEFTENRPHSPRRFNPVTDLLELIAIGCRLWQKTKKGD